jgi:hypothetical protein
MGGSLYDYAARTYADAGRYSDPQALANAQASGNRGGPGLRPQFVKGGKALGAAATKHAVKQLTGKKKRASTEPPTAAPTSPPVHRRFEPQSNSPGTTTMNSGEEVPVMPPPRKIAKIHPDYFTVNLPFCFRIGSLDGANFLLTNSVPAFIIRLNSIYDPFKEIRTGNDAEDNTLVDPETEGDRQPAGRDLWAAHFKYYRVLSSHVKITVLWNGPSYYDEYVLAAGPPIIYATPFFNSFVHGYELTDEDGQIADRVESFMTTKKAKRKILPAAESQVLADDTVRSVRPSRDTLTYSYNPATWTHHVEEKSSEERWTPVGQNPAIDHDLNYRFMHLYNGIAPRGTFDILVTVNYMVQFREPLDSIFKVHDQTAPTYGGTGEDALDD